MPVILIPSKPLNPNYNVPHECRLSVDSLEEESKETTTLPHHSHSKSHCLPFLKPDEEDPSKEDDDPFFQFLVSFAESLQVSESIPTTFRLRTL